MFAYDLSLIFLILGYIAFLYVAKLQSHVHMLTANIISCWLVAIYLAINGAYVGASVSTIAGFASLSQILLVKSGTLGTMKVRNSVAIAFTALAVSILYQKPNDLLPCIAFTQNRILEAQGCTQCIRFAMFFGTLLWAGYAFSQQLYLMAFLEMTVSVYALTCLIKHSRRLKRLNNQNDFSKENLTPL